MSTSTEHKARKVGQVLLGLVKFAVLIAILLGVIYLLNQYLLKTYYYELNPKTETLICGPSVLRCSIDPEIIPHSENISQEGEFYGISRVKLDYILSQDQKPENLILYFSPSMLLNKTDKLILNPLLQKQIIQRIYPIATADDFIDRGLPAKTVFQNIFQAQFLPNMDYWPLLWKKEIKPHHYPYIGKFRRHFKSKVAKTTESILRNIRPEDRWESTFKPGHIEDLRYIIHLAQENDIQVILANIPEHPEIKKLNTTYIDSQFVSLEKDLLSDQRIQLFDMSDVILPDSMFFNISHLNTYGAKICSDSLKTWMIKRKLTQAN